MKTRSTPTKLVVPVAALVLFGTTIVAFTQRTSSPVTRTSVCVKDNGQMRMVTGGATACDSSERQVDLVTDVRVGSGLVASREDGLINLGLDPSFLQTCGSCNGGRVFAGFNDGPGEIPNGEPPSHEPAQMAKLDLPEGDYAIFAKMVLGNDRNWVHCKLTAGSDSDEAFVILEENDWPNIDGASYQVMKLQLVHHFDAPGSVALSCTDVFPYFGATSQGNAQFKHLKIIAMKASNISNVFLGN